MINKKCDCCGKSDMKTGDLQSTLSEKKYTYCLICGAISAEPKELIKEVENKIKTGTVIEDSALLIYFDEETDTYIDVRKGVFKFKFKDKTILTKRTDIVKRAAKQESADDIF